jgi:hypothetical protein
MLMMLLLRLFLSEYNLSVSNEQPQPVPPVQGPGACELPPPASEGDIVTLIVTVFE